MAVAPFFFSSFFSSSFFLLNDCKLAIVILKVPFVGAEGPMR
jgi:hypothetical protein